MNRHRAFCFKASVAALAAAFSGAPYANPANPTVVAGSAVFQQSGKTLTVTNTPGAIINWQSFNIDRGELTRFIQQSASSQVLNRVTGGDPSKILGSLQSNGRVILINPNGIAFGAGAQVDVAGLLISTLQIKDADYLAGKLKFNDTPGAGSIKNEGTIKTASGGQVILIAPQIENSGLIHTPEGQILLAAGKSVTLADPDRPAIQVEISNSEQKAINLGTLIGKEISLYGGLVKNSGSIQATTAVVGQNGKISLRAKYEVENTGTLQANGAQGGDIVVQAEQGTARVQGLVEAKALTPEQVVLQQQAIEQKVQVASVVPVDNVVAEPLVGSNEASFTQQADPAAPIPGAVLADAWIKAGTGSILVDADTPQITQPTGPLAPLDSSPLNPNSPLLPPRQQGHGGSVRVLGRVVRVDEGGAIDATGTSGGGEILIGGNRQGANAAIQNARETTVAGSAVLDASATSDGNGGKVVIWSDGVTTFAGHIRARGGEAGGNGGFAEVSGLQGLGVTGHADLAAPHGRAGEMLLDPGSLTISTSASNAATGTLNDAWVTGQLANSHLTLATTDGGLTTNNATQDITISAALAWASAYTLTLNAGRNIAINNNVTVSGGGGLTLNAGQSTTGTSTLQSGSTVELGGGQLVFSKGLSLPGGTVKNTVLSSADGSVLTSSDGNLDRVTISGNLAKTGRLRLANTLTFLDNATLSSDNNGLVVTSSDFSLLHTGVGEGSLRLAGSSLTGSTTGTLTVGSGVAVRGYGVIDNISYGYGNLVNAGLIESDVAGKTLYFYRAASLTNTGTIRATAGTMTVGSVSIVNNGTLEAAGGTLNLGGGLATETWTNNGTIAVTSGTLNLTGMMTTAGLGTFSRSGGTVNLSGVLDNTGSIFDPGAASSTGQLQITGGTIIGGTVANTGPSALSATSVFLNGVTLDADITVTAGATVSNGLTLANGHKVFLQGSYNGTNLIFSGTGNQALAGSGEIVFVPGAQGSAMVYASSTSGTLEIGQNIRIHGDGIGGMVGWVNYGSVINHGVIDADEAGKTLQIGGRFTNAADGRVKATSGTISLNGTNWANAGTFEVGTGTFDLGGTFDTAGIGTINRTGGTVRLTGTMNNTGSVFDPSAAGSTGDLIIQNGSVVGGTITNTGAATLTSSSGTLNGVTLDADLTVLGGTLNIVNGLTFSNGHKIILGGAYAGTLQVMGSGNQQLSGNGELVFAHDSAKAYAYTAGGTLEINSGIRVHGTSSGQLGYAGYGLINHGIVEADTAGKTITVAGNFSNAADGRIQASLGTVAVNGTNWSNSGTLQVDNGGTLNLGGSFSTADIGTLINTGGGTTRLTGTLNNTGNTLTLTDTIGSLNIGSGGTLQGGTLAVAAGSTSKYYGDGGTLDGVTLNGDLWIKLGSTFTVRNGLTLNNSTLYLGEGSGNSSSTLYWNGSQTISGVNGRIAFNAGSHNGILNGSGSAGTTLTLGSGITVDSAGSTGYIHGTGYNVINNGTIVSGASGKTIYIQPSGTVVNNGTLKATGGGTLQIGGNWTNNGTLQVDNASTVNLGGSFTTAGLGTLINSGTVRLTGSLNNTGATLNPSAAGSTGTFNLAGGTIVGGTLDNTGSATLGVTASSTLNGVVLDTDLVSGSGLYISNGLTLANGHKLTIGSASSPSSVRFQGAGTQQLSGTGEIVFGPVATSSLISNAAGETLEIGANIRIYGGAGGYIGMNGASVINHGTIESSGATSNIGLWGNFTNASDGRLIASAGTVNAYGSFSTNDGSIDIASGATFRTNNASLTNSATGVIRGAGTLDFGYVRTGAGSAGDPYVYTLKTLTNNGTIDPGVGAGGIGSLTIKGDLIQGAGGKLHIDLGGTAAGQHDKVVVAGITSPATKTATAQLAGTLEVAEANGFYADLGSSFGTDFITATGGLSGSFTSFSQPADVSFTASLTAASGIGITGTTTSISSWASDSAGDWSTAGNWSRGVPTAGKDVMIGRISADPLVTVSAAGATARSLYLDDALKIDGQTLTIGAGTINGNVTLANNGSITTDGNLYPSGNKTLYWSSGTIDGNGGLNFLNGANIGFSGSGDRVMDSAGLNFAFTDLNLPDGSLTLRNGALTFNTTLTGATNIPTGTALNLYGGTLTNNGPLNVSGLFGLYGGTLAGNGAINMTGGTIDMPANSTVNWTATGTMNNSGTLNLGNRTITNAITNTGTINSSGGLTFTQLFTNQGTVNLLGGTTTFSGGYNQTAGVTTFNGGNAAGNMTLNGGSLGGSGTLTGSLINNSGILAVGFSPGTFNITGNLTLGAASTTNIELGGAVAGSGYDVINVSGTATLGGTLNVTSYAGYTPAAGVSHGFMNFGSSSGAFAATNLPAGWSVSLNSYATYLDLLMAAATVPVLTPAVATVANALTAGETSIGFERVEGEGSDIGLVQSLAMATQFAQNDEEFQELKQCQ